MAMMKSPEGDSLPGEGLSGESGCWDVCLFAHSYIRLSLLIPMYLETKDGQFYDGSGVLTVGLAEIFDEYLADNEDIDGGVGLLPLAALLREFADKCEAKHSGITHKNLSAKDWLHEQYG